MIFLYCDIGISTYFVMNKIVKKSFKNLVNILYIDLGIVNFSFEIKSYLNMYSVMFYSLF